MGLLPAQTAWGCKKIPTTEKGPYPVLAQDQSQEGGSRQTFRHRKWLGSKQYETNKMFKEAGGAVESPL